MTIKGSQIQFQLGNGFTAEGIVDTVLPNGRFRVVTASVYDINGTPTNVFVVESVVCYKLVSSWAETFEK